MQKTKALRWPLPGCVRRVEKYNTIRQAYSYFWGYMLRKYQGENLRSDSTLPIRSLPHDLVMGGIPHAGYSSNYIYIYTHIHIYIFQILFHYLSLLLLFSCVWLFATPWSVACQASLSFTVSHSLLKLTSHWVGDAIQPSHPLSSPSPPASTPTQPQSRFQWVNSLHEMAKVLEFQST